MPDMELVDHMEQVWQSIAKLCAPFTEEQWKTPTDCPGWSVQDQISHLVGAEVGSSNPGPCTGGNGPRKKRSGATERGGC